MNVGVSASDLPALSRLFDEALSMPVDVRERWLSGWPEGQRHLREPLLEMLASEVAAGTLGASMRLPNLGVFDDAETPKKLELIGPYRLLRKLGQGGMGTVWLAERADGTLKRQVALKLPRMAWGAGLSERMARERDIVGMLEHPNIARLYDAGVDAKGRPYLALEYIDGQPIDTYCATHGLDTGARLKLFLPVARAVAYAHGRLVVHRDLKPSNVLVSADGQAHLLDFGIAKLLDDSEGTSELTRQQGQVMTPVYASPEQVLRQAVTVQSDVYSLGVLLYELLTGVVPFTPSRGTMGALEEAILQGDAPPASTRVTTRAVASVLRGEIDAILAKAMQRDPERRYATADAMALDVDRFLRGETVTARPDSLGYRLRKAVRRHWLGMSATSAVVLALGIGGGASLLQAQRAVREAERSRLTTAFVTELFALDAKQEPKGNSRELAPRETFLDRGAELINARFQDQPDIQARLYGAVGQVYTDIGAGSLAVKYARRQAEALRKVSTDTSDSVRSQILLARALDAADQDIDGMEEARKAADRAAGNDQLRGEALAVLGWLQINNGRKEEARASAIEAERLLRASRAPASIAMSEVLMVQANLKLWTDEKLEEGLSIAERAVANAIAVQGPQSPFAVKLRVWIANALLFAGRIKEAREVESAAMEAVRGTGGAGEIVGASKHAQFLHTLFDGGNISFDEADAEIERARAAVASRASSIPPFVLAKINFFAGAIRLQWGDLEGAARLLLPSSQLIKKESSFQELLGRVFHQEVTLLMNSGQHEAAADLIKQRTRLAAAVGPEERAQSRAIDALYMALNHLMQARHDAVDQDLADAQELVRTFAETATGKRTQMMTLEVRAMSHLARSDAQGALKAIRQYEALIPNTLGAKDLDPELKGEVLCSAGFATEGAAMLANALKSMEGRSSPRNPSLARVRATAGLCQLMQGNRVQAAALATAARAALQDQPDVSQYFKAPLQRLDALLRRKPPVS